MEAFATLLLVALQIFDLKGSMRNRLVNTSGKRIEDLVLLDENLLKCMNFLWTLLKVDFLRTHNLVKAF